MRTILVTGGAGFIGSHLVRHLLHRYERYTVINFDKLTYAGNLQNLEDMEDHARYRFIKGDICDRSIVESLVRDFNIDAIVNVAAESHVDRSIIGSAPFVETNIVGTHTLLEAARRAGIERFLQISTDEVYGSLGPVGRFTETSLLQPTSPYAVSKASADLLTNAYFRTYGIPVVIARSSNNYGPNQFPEKLIPLMVINALQDRRLPIYGDGQNVRDWLYVEDNCEALDLILHGGKAGETYNIGANEEWRNIDVVKVILKHLGKPESLIEYVKDRPGHDRRYSTDASKVGTELGWRPSQDFEEGIKMTVDWYSSHAEWWKRVMNGEYQSYYRKVYEER